jgi:hypothetical protein
MLPTGDSYFAVPEEFFATGDWIGLAGAIAATKKADIAGLLFSVTNTASAYIYPNIESTSAQIGDYEMTRLEALAEVGDERSFVLAQTAMEWRTRPPADFVRGIQLALAADAHLVARQLAKQGSERYPDNIELQKYVRVLAPPKVIQSNLPSDPALKANRNWLKTNALAFRGKWVALQNGQLLGSAGSLSALTNQVGNTKGIFFTKVF